MDGNHAFGSTLLGLAFTALLVRIFWMGSPPFSRMPAARRSAWSVVLVLSAIAMMLAGGFLLSRPISAEALKRIAEEGYRFH